MQLASKRYNGVCTADVAVAPRTALVPCTHQKQNGLLSHSSLR